MEVSEEEAWALLCDDVLEAGCDGFAADEVPAVGGYAWLPGLAEVVPCVDVVVPGFIAVPGSCTFGYFPLPCVHCSSTTWACWVSYQKQSMVETHSAAVSQPLMTSMSAPPCFLLRISVAKWLHKNVLAQAFASCAACWE